MQSINLNIAPGTTQIIPCVGNGIWFESGASTTSNPYVSVKPDTGAEFTLKPGQHCQDQSIQTGTWRITALDPTANITGRVIIGNGDFGDSNVNNTFKLDGTFVNSVNVNNTTAQRVPVTLDTTQSIGINNTTANRIPVSLDTSQTLQLATNTVAYNSAFTSTAGSSINTAIQMLPAASNVNGAILNKFDIIVSSNTPFAVIAKATAPANIGDGDVLFCADANAATATKYSLDISKDGQIKAQAGKGIWYISTAADGCKLRDALFTVL
jgi:hypothetical protein